MNAILNVTGLSVELQTRIGPVEAIDQVDLRIAAGETVCLVGESGSGKTVTSLSILRLIDYKGGRLTRGAIRLQGRDLATLSQRDMRDLRGDRIGIVFQEPMTAFDPLFTIGAQIAEVIERHRGAKRTQAMQQAIALLRRVKMPDADLRATQYPHQMSGGMLQRAMIAMALACEPELLIADEPTTALDVTIQAQILTLLKELQAENGMAILLVTHDLGVAAEIADRVVVMYAGRIVEDAPVGQLFAGPAHPYARSLLQSVIGPQMARGERLYSIPGSIPGLAQLLAGCRFHPRCDRASGRCAIDVPPLVAHKAGHVACWHPHIEKPAAASGTQAQTVAREPDGDLLVELTAVHKSYAVGHGWLGAPERRLHAVDDISLQIRRGETFGLVGESGSGKSTLARVLMQLEPATSGQVVFDGHDLTRMNSAELRRIRRHMQMIFQDPFGSIDPRWTVGDIIGEPLAAHETLSRAQRRERIRSLLDQVGLDANWDSRFPHQLSGGQRQRVAIARAIALRPRFLLADEAVSALDVSVRAQIINLLQDIKDQLGLTCLFIGHELNLVRHVSDRIGVMYLGKLVEIGPADDVFFHPAHHYTRALLAAIPEPDPEMRGRFVPIAGEIASPVNPPPGCRFQARCAAAADICRQTQPPLRPIAAHRAVACHFPV